MALTELTQQGILEAKIAASLATDPDLLPSKISELSDQAAIFASNNANVFMFTGSADADSENTNFGESLATKAIEKVIELEERRRKEDDPALDTQELLDLGERQRAELQKISVGGIELSLEDWDDVADALQTEEGVNAAREALMAQGKTAEEANEVIRLTQLLASAAQKQHDGIPFTPDEKAAVARAKSDPELQEDIKTTTGALLNVSQNGLTLAQVADRNTAAIKGESAFMSARADILDDANLVGENLAVREGMSVAGSSDLASSFEAGFSAAPEFNEQAMGNVQLAEATPLQSVPTASVPTLANG